MIWTVPDFPLAPSVDVKVRGVKTKTLHPKPLNLNFQNPKSLHLPTQKYSSLSPRDKAQKKETARLGPPASKAIRVCWGILGYMGIVEKKMETTTTGLLWVKGLGLGLYGDNGKESGNYYRTLG